MKFIGIINFMMYYLILSIILNGIKSNNLRTKSPTEGALQPFMAYNPSDLDIKDIQNMRSISARPAGPEQNYRFAQKAASRKDPRDEVVGEKYKGVNI